MQIQVAKIFKPLFTDSLSTYRLLFFYGGRGGGKSLHITLFLIMKCLENQGIKVVITRDKKTLKRDSIHALAKRLLKSLDIMNLCNVTNDIIKFTNGSQIIFSGLSMQTIDGARGLDEVKYFFFDEAHKINEELLTTLIPSVRALNSQLIFSLNPQRSDDFLYKTFINNKEGEQSTYYKALKVNYTDNPFFNETLERDRMQDYHTLPRELYNHIWLGETNDFNDQLVIDIQRIGRFETYDDYSCIVLSIDTATSTKKHADYTCLSIVGKCKGKDEVHIIHMLRGKYDWHTLLEKIQSVYSLCQNLTKQAVHVILIEGKANGLNVMQELQRTTSLNVKTIQPIQDKLTRVINYMLPYLDRLKIPLDIQNIYNFWIEDFLHECKLFRSDGKHANDDMIDTITQAIEYIYKNQLDFSIIKDALRI